MSFEGVYLFTLYLFLGLGLLAVFARLYTWITPYDEAIDIAQGKIAPAIALAGALIGFTLPLLVASYTRSSVLGFIAWGSLACLVQLLLFWLLAYKLMPRMIETNNPAGATCFAAASVCVGMINAASMLP